MKKLFCVLAVTMILAGCATQPALETVCDVLDMEAVAIKRQIQLTLPKEVAAPAIQCDDGNRLYLCDGYTLMLQTFSGGDLDRTLRNVTGFGKDDLTVMQTEQDGFMRYECVWSAAAEEGEQVARAVIMDDGCYHYVVTVMSDCEVAGELTQTWQTILSSVSLKDTA